MVRFAWPGWWLGLLVGIGSPAAAQANTTLEAQRALIETHDDKLSMQALAMRDVIATFDKAVAALDLAMAGYQALAPLDYNEAGVIRNTVRKTREKQQQTLSKTDAVLRWLDSVLDTPPPAVKKRW